MEVLANKASRRMQSVHPTKTWTANCLHLGILILTVALTGCGGGGSSAEAPSGPRTPGGINISGKAAVEDTPLTGAVVAISKLDITQASETQSRRGKIVSVGLENFQPTVGADGVFSFQLPNDLLQDDILYSLSLTCPQPVTSACPLQAPLHAVLSGSRLKQGEFTVNVLTEVVYQRLGYYIAAGFKAPELRQEMDALTRILFAIDLDGENGIDYEDVTRWHPTEGASQSNLRRPAAVSKIMAALSGNDNASELQLAVQSLFGPIATNLKLEGGADLIAIYEDHAYIVGGKILHTIDISNPLQPKSVHKLALPGDIDDMQLIAPYLYFAHHTDEAASKSGFQIVDITTAKQPTLRGSIPLQPNLENFAIKNNIAYLTFWAPEDPLSSDDPSGLQIVDISDPNAPVVKSVLNFDDPSQNDSVKACGIAITGDYAYVGEIYGIMHVVNISEATSPKEERVMQVPGPNCNMAIHKKLAYISTQFSGLHILDLEDTSNIPKTIQMNLNGLLRRLAVAENRIYLASAQSGLAIVDISNTQQHQLLNIIDTPGLAADVAVKGKYVFVADEAQGLQVMEAEAPPQPLLTGSINTGGVDVAIEDNYAYILANWPILRALNIQDLTNLKSTNTVEEGSFYPGALAVRNQYAYLAHDRTFRIFDVSNVNNLIPLGTLETSGWALDVAASGNSAFLAAGLAGMQIIDTSNPSNPILNGDFATSDEARGIAIKDWFAFVAVSSKGMDIFDLNQTNNRSPLVNIDSSGTANKVFLEGNTAYLADGLAGLQIIDVSTPMLPQTVSRIDTPGNAVDVTVVNSIAYVADEYAGVQAIDVSDRSHPSLIGSARTNTGALSVTENSGHIFVSTWYDLEILRAIPAK